MERAFKKTGDSFQSVPVELALWSLEMIRIAISVEDDIVFHKEEDLDVEESRMFCQ